MVQLQQSGRYDDAIRVVQDWMNEHPGDSADDFLHLQLAMVYTIKAYHKISTDDSLRNAAAHLEQALQVYTPKPKGADNILLEIGTVYETIGDLSQGHKCQYFAKARKALQDQLPLIEGDSYTAHRKTVPLEPIRAEVGKHLAAVDAKSKQAGCSTPD